ncbi:MAG: aminopeptidase, partial [Prevotella sp.]|nr:aminopeptidase [Prevotella sp.]
MNKKNIITMGLCLALSTGINAQTSEGGISTQMLQKMEKSHAASPTNKALFNAIATNAIDNLAKNFANEGPVDNVFSIETPKQSIHDQKSSGRCWMFSGLNVLRANFAKAHEDTLSVEFSHDYLFFYDQLEKANLMLQGVIDCANKPMDDVRVQFFFHHPLGDGGTFCGVSDLAEKYGLVPMSAQPETYSAENTSRASRMIAAKLREFGLELRDMVAKKQKANAIQNRKGEMLCTIYNM